jgi:putative salt-induced outer membrane protein YdiY
MKHKDLRTLVTGAVALLLGPLAPAFSAPDPAPANVVTNYVTVTNIVVVTNYVVTTNLVLTTNGPGLVPRPGKRPLPGLSWVPPNDGYDWIQLKSGEWLKGKIKALQDRKLEFDSQELKLLTFDFKDIRQMRSPQYNELLHGDKQKAAGTIAITPDEVTVGGDEPLTFPRAELQSITPGGSRELNYWSGKVSVGLTLREGNTKQVDFNAQASLQRRTPATRFKLDYIGNISSVDEVESANNHRLNTEFDLWFSRRLYAILPFFEYYKDPFQNIDRRFTVGGGLGYDIFARPNLEWTVTTGPAYQHTWFESVQAGQPPDRGAAALAFGSKFEWDITQRINVTLEYRGQYTSREAGETFHHTVATLELELTRRLDLDISLVWDRTQVPQTESNGTVPKQDDLRLVLGLGVRF